MTKAPAAGLKKESQSFRNFQPDWGVPTTPLSPAHAERIEVIPNLRAGMAAGRTPADQGLGGGTELRNRGTP